MKRQFLLLLLVTATAVACNDDGGVPVGALRFGQVGELRVSLAVPLVFGAGELRQTLVWSSDGSWHLRESISYRRLAGDETEMRRPGDPRAYASLITQINDSPALKLFLDDLPQELDPECGMGETRVSFLIRDRVRGRDASWARCAQGSLATLLTAEAGPDPQAVRVIQAAILVRDDYTLGAPFLSAYVGSIPFGTLDRGEDSGARLAQPRAFVSVPEGSPVIPTGWPSFWQAHKGSPTAPYPEVDWTTEMVVVAAVGERTEAGDSVEVRRILQTGEGTRVHIVQRVPGDFCSPAARIHYPVHIVVAPRTALPILFNEVVTERVPCGL